MRWKPSQADRSARNVFITWRRQKLAESAGAV
jgi:hypothetical protein